MKEYEVGLPITGVVWTTVEAESEADAIQKALESDLHTDDVEEWQAHRVIVEGNIFHGVQNEPRVVDTEPDDSE